MFARDSAATRHNIMLTEKPPDIAFEVMSAADVATGAATSVPDSACEISTSEVTHSFEVWSGM